MNCRKDFQGCDLSGAFRKRSHTESIRRDELWARIAFHRTAMSFHGFIPKAKTYTSFDVPGGSTRTHLAQCRRRYRWSYQTPDFGRPRILLHTAFTAASTRRAAAFVTGLLRSTSREPRWAGQDPADNDHGFMSRRCHHAVRLSWRVVNPTHTGITTNGDIVGDFTNDN